MKKTNEVMEKKTRAIKETNKADFLAVVNEVRNILTGDEFESSVCELTANGLYKLTSTKPADMTGVKTFEKVGVKWFKVPTTDYKVSLFSYFGYRLTNRQKAKAKNQKTFNNLTIEQQQEVLARFMEMQEDKK